MAKNAISWKFLDFNTLIMFHRDPKTSSAKGPQAPKQGACRAPYPSAGTRRKGMECPELLVNINLRDYPSKINISHQNLKLKNAKK